MFPNKEDMLEAAFTLAEEISTKSPVAVQSTKVNLIYSRNHSVAESLNYMVRLSVQPITAPLQSQSDQSGPLQADFCRPCPPIGALSLPCFSLAQLHSLPLPLCSTLFIQATWNMSMLQTQDIVKSVQATLEKKDLKSVNFSKL